MTGPIISLTIASHAAASATPAKSMNSSSPVPNILADLSHTAKRAAPSLASTAAMYMHRQVLVWRSSEKRYSCSVYMLEELAQCTQCTQRAIACSTPCLQARTVLLLSSLSLYTNNSDQGGAQFFTEFFQHERCAPVTRIPGCCGTRRAEQDATSPRDFCPQCGFVKNKTETLFFPSILLE